MGPLRSYGVDVAAYQPTSLKKYYDAGAKFAIIKATEGTGYFNPNAVGQIKSAHHYKMFVHAYHFANFGHSIHQAKIEAKFFVERCKALNISRHRYLVLDWEGSPYNYVQGDVSDNTQAIIAFMNTIKKLGYKPMLYSSASLLDNNIGEELIVKNFGDCIWVASYAKNGRIDNPNFAYFPSMPGVAIWQFTDDWHGLNVDGNIALTNINMQKKATSSKASKPKHAENLQKKLPSVVYAPVINGNSNYMISLRDSNGHATGKYIPTNSSWKVFAEKEIHGMKYYRLGTNQQWVPAKYLKVI